MPKERWVLAMYKLDIHCGWWRHYDAIFV